MKNSLVIGLVVACIVFAVLTWKGCKDQEKILADANAKINAAVAIALEADKAKDSAIDREQTTYVTYQMEKVQWTVDSSRMADLIDQSNVAIEHERGIYKGLAAQYDSAKAVLDTAGQLTACDSAFRELHKANIAVIDLQNNVNSSIAAYGQELDRRDSLIEVQRTNFEYLNRTYDKLHEAYGLQAAASAKLLKEAQKTWSISVGAGFVAGPKGAGPGAAIIIAKQILRFKL